MFFCEIVVVVIGIFIVLFINNWNEDIKNRKFIEKMLYVIGEEIWYSKKDIEGIFFKYYKIINVLILS